MLSGRFNFMVFEILVAVLYGDSCHLVCDAVYGNSCHLVCDAVYGDGCLLVCDAV